MSEWVSKRDRTQWFNVLKYTLEEHTSLCQHFAVWSKKKDKKKKKQHQHAICTCPLALLLGITIYSAFQIWTGRTWNERNKKKKEKQRWIRKEREREKNIETSICPGYKKNTYKLGKAIYMREHSGIPGKLNIQMDFRRCNNVMVSVWLCRYK